MSESTRRVLRHDGFDLDARPDVPLEGKRDPVTLHAPKAAAPRLPTFSNGR